MGSRVTTAHPPEASGAPSVVLPRWPTRTVAVLSTLSDRCPHAIPVSAPVRAADDLVLIALRADRDSLARLRAAPQVALTLLTDPDIAFTARGTAQPLDDALDESSGYVAVAIRVVAVDDHRQEAFAVTSGIGREWRDPAEQRALAGRVAALQALVATPPGSAASVASS